MSDRIAIELVKEHLRAHGLEFLHREGSTFVDVSFTTREVRWTMVVEALGCGRLGVFCYVPVNVPELRRPEVAEAIARANYGLRLGAFEMDFDDGEVRLRVMAPMLAHAESLEDLDPTLTDLIGAGIAHMERYAGALIRCAFSDDDPAELIDDAERSDAPDGSDEETGEESVADDGADTEWGDDVDDDVDDDDVAF